MTNPKTPSKKGGSRARRTGRLEVLKAMAANARILKAGPRTLRFLCKYMGKFRIRKAGGNLIIHSHLPPINSRAYGRFVDVHLLGNGQRPSHAQIGLTDACPQNCGYCYNRGRSGRPMSTATILSVIRELEDLGVFWLGFTGGEPLLNRDIVKITAAASRNCAVKLFTTGCGLSPELAAGLRDAGLFSVSVSLDNSDPEEHDRGRGYPGAFREALRAVEIFKETGGIQVGISSVLSKDMVRRDKAEAFLDFLESLGIDEAWISEMKPSVQPFWNESLLLRHEERRELIALQDERNANGGMTVNYLGHFESGEHFGCNAGSKMIYVDAFGEVGPCVFVPLSFGNVRDKSLKDIAADMGPRFAPQDRCFMSSNYACLRKHSHGVLPITGPSAAACAAEAEYGRPPAFWRMRNGH
jgi:MoaA/NifB/PqqE/SkfB family radical SAM enzyme